MSSTEAKFWKLYREERAKFVRALHPGIKKPFQVKLSATQITRIARLAAGRAAGKEPT